MRRVVVTGMGLVTPVGVGVESTWEAITNSKSGIGKIEHFDVSDITCKVAAQVKRGEGGFSADHVLPAKEQRKVDDFILFAMVAAEEAIQQSGWVADSEEKQHRTGVLIGSGIGGLPVIERTVKMIEESGPRRISPFFIPACLINLASGQVSIKHGFKGPNHSVVTACSTGAHAIGDASRLIQYGDADVMIAGSAEATICRTGIAGFAAARALSTSYNDTPEKASRPWDSGRDGFVMGEGAGVVVLEEYEHAKARGATIYGEVVGYGLSGDAHHITAPADDGDGGFRAMQSAMKHAGINPEEIGYVNAHGTSTPKGDEIELGAVKRLFGSAVETMSMSSTKSSIGHLLGGAGSVEGILAMLAMNRSVLPPTLNLDDPSESCVGVDLVPHTAKEKKVSAVLSNSFGFGGTNASLIFKAV